MIFNTGSGGNATRIVTGKSLHLADTAGGKYKNIKLVGASVQNGTPAVSKPVDIVSNKVKSITGCGKNLFGFEKSAIDVTEELRKLDNQRLIFTKINDNSIKCNYSWGTYATGYVEFEGVDGTKDYAFSFVVKENSLGYTPRIEKATNHCTENKLVLSIYSGNGATEVSGNEYFILENIQVESGTEVTPYEPYVSNTAELDETYELNGINGIYDEIDLERGVRIQRFGVQVFNGSETWHKYSEQYPHLFTTEVRPYANGLNAVLCSHFPYDSGDLLKGRDECRFRIADVAGVFYVSSSEHTDATAFKSWLASNNVTLVYELAEPVETPLSVDELIAFNKLRAYKSGSTLFSGCDMEVEYFLNNKVGQPMADTHLNTAKYILDGATLNIIV